MICLDIESLNFSNYLSKGRLFCLAFFFFWSFGVKTDNTKEKNNLTIKQFLAQLLIDPESVFMCLFYCVLSFLISLVKARKDLD